jgi:hypothetical protein
MFRSLAGFDDASWWIYALMGKKYKYTHCATPFLGLRYLSGIVIKEKDSP